MARKLILSSILMALFSLFTLGTTTNYVHAGEISPGTLFTLQHDDLYRMPESADPEEWMNKMIRLFIADLKKHPEDQQTHLFLGDAYHWKGHILEARGKFDEAFLAYKKAREHYLISDAPYSPGLNFHWPLGHANKHLARLARTQYYEINPDWMEGWFVKTEVPDKDAEMKAYSRLLRETEKRVQDSMLLIQPGEEHHECEKLFINIPE